MAAWEGAGSTWRRRKEQAPARPPSSRRTWARPLALGKGPGLRLAPPRVKPGLRVGACPLSPGSLLPFPWAG